MKDIAKKEATGLQEQAQNICQLVSGLEIKEQTDYETMVEYVKRIKRLLKAIDEQNDPTISAAHAAWKTALAQKAKLTDPLKDGEKAGKKKIDRWDDEQERKRLAEEARLRKIAQDKEDREKLKLAEKLEEAGDVEAAEAVLDAPSTAPLITLAAPKTAGVARPETWHYEVIGEVPREFMTTDHQKIQKYVTAMKQDAAKPWLRVYSTKSASIKA